MGCCDKIEGVNAVNSVTQTFHPPQTALCQAFMYLIHKVIIWSTISLIHLHTVTLGLILQMLNCSI